MQSRSRLNLLLVFIALLICIWILLRPQQNKDEIKLISNIATNEIKQIVISRAGTTTLTFERSTYWRVTQPLQAYADTARMQTILNLLQNHSYNQFKHNEITDLNQLGLADPKVSLQLNNYTFYFGTTDPINEHRYIRFNNDIHLIKDNLYPQLLQSAAFFISRRLLPPEMKINQLDMPGLKISQHANGWDAQAESNLTQKQIKQIIKSWQNAEANSTNLITLQTKAETITIAGANGTRIQFHPVAKDNKVFLIRKDLGAQYELSDTVAKSLKLIREDEDA